MPDDGVLVIGGRRFRPPDQITYRQRLYMRRQVTAAKLHEVPTEDQAPALLGQNLIAAVSASGLQPELLAAWLVEDGESWSEKGAVRNAAFFGNVTDPADMDLLDGAILPLLVLFFVGKPSSPATSPSSSDTGEPDPATPTSETPATAPPATAAA